MQKLYLTQAFKFYRTARQWTQQEYADFLAVGVDIEISRNMIQKWEQGVRPIAPGYAMAISKATGIAYKDLVERK